MRFFFSSKIFLSKFFFYFFEKQILGSIHVCKQKKRVSFSLDIARQLNWFISNKHKLNKANFLYEYPHLSLFLSRFDRNFRVIKMDCYAYKVIHCLLEIYHDLNQLKIESIRLESVDRLACIRLLKRMKKNSKTHQTLMEASLNLRVHLYRWRVTSNKHFTMIQKWKFVA